jgi:hypothetical protein
MPGPRRSTWVLVAVAALAIVMAVGCAPRIDHAYDPSANFGGRTYAWAPGSPINSPSRLVEANVRSIADPLLEKKGFTKVSANPDLVIAVKLANPYGSVEAYELKTLDLNVYRADGQTLIWRGTASSSIGSIRTDAASGELIKAVQGILEAFPPG